MELSGRLDEATIYFLSDGQLHVSGWRDRNASLIWRYKGRSKSEGAVGKGEDQAVCRAGSVWHNACSRDFSPSFPCEVLQEGDYAFTSGCSGPRPAVAQLLHS